MPRSHGRRSGTARADAARSLPPDATRTALPTVPRSPRLALRQGADRVRGWWRRRDRTVLLLVVVALLALAPRLYGLNWDAGNALHPDERQIVFRAMCLGFPGTPRPLNCEPAATGPGWFLTPASPLNPHFFAYGSLPLYLLALVAHGLNWLTALSGGAFRPPDGGTWDDFAHFLLVGRALSALFDAGTVLLTGLLARRLIGRRLALLAAALVAVIPFEVQLAHFYAVDTVLAFFTTLTLLACVRLAQVGVAPNPERATTLPDIWAPWRLGLALGVSLALAMATKVSALPLLLPIVVALVLRWRRRGLDEAVSAAFGVVGAALLVFVLVSPYTFIDWSAFRAQVNEQTSLAQGQLDYPYVRQFAGTAPYLYHLGQLLRFDLEPPLALAAFAGVAWALVRLWRRPLRTWAIPIAWLVAYFGAVGGTYVKFSRYLLPLYATLAICAAALLGWLAVTVARRFPRAWWRRAGLALALAVLAASALFTLAFDAIYSAPNTRVQASQWIYDHVPPGSLLTNEIWDDPLPIRLAPQTSGVARTPSGHPADPQQYRQVGLDLYAADTPQKAVQLAQELSAANVVVISSQRLLGSIPKLPDRYPMTTRYYQLLFAGKLGFTLAAHFQTQPHLLGFSLDETGADESYSVYDHPPVWLFVRQGAGLSATQIESALTQGLTLPATSTRAGNQRSLLLDPAQQAANAASPSLAQQFPPASLPNQVPLLWWLLVVEVLGLAAFPLAYSAFPGLRDRGWGLSKLVGLLLLAYATWLPASLGLLPFDNTEALAIFAALVLLGAGVAWWRRRELVAFLRARWRLLVLGEALFLVAFLFFTWVRALDPDLWHIYRGGEKPMELTFLNGILRSRSLPPLDPWFSGGYINYYYYGQYLIAVLIRVTGIVPTTAFNLAVPLLFAVTATAAFSLGLGLTRRWWVGLAAAAGLVLVGNLDGLGQLVGRWRLLVAGQVPPPFDYWQSSRVIPYTINEFPYWSFLYADLHAHLIDLPIVVLILAACVSLVRTVRRDGMAWRPALPTLAVLALALGAAWCVNTWDWPTYALAVGVAVLLRLVPFGRAEAWQAPREWLSWPRLRATLAALVATLGGSYLLYLPFHQNFQNFVSGVNSVSTPTASGLFVVLFGIWLFLTVSFFFVEMRDRLPADGISSVVLALLFGLPLLVALLLSLKALLVLLLALGLLLALHPRHSPAKVFTYAMLLLGLAVALGVELIYVRDFLDNSPWERMNTVFKFYYQVWTLLALGSVCALVYVLPRVWGRRGPTADAVAAAEVLPVWSLGEASALALRGLWTLTLAGLLFGSLIFLVQGTQVRVQDPAIWAQVQPPPGGVQPVGLSLDGMAYMRGWHPSDYAAITWLNAHVAGAPTLVEASNGPYAWYGRVSIYTGLPSVLGWSSHESQQRYPDQVYARQADVQRFYTTASVTEAEAFLRAYGVRYVYLGGLERTCATTTPQNACVPLAAPALAKFEAMRQAGVLQQVYAGGNVVIYRVQG